MKLDASETLITVLPIFGEAAPAKILVAILSKLLSETVTSPLATVVGNGLILSSAPILLRASPVALSTEKSLSI